MSKKKAAGIVFTDGSSILLLKRAGEGKHIGAWSMPGGKAIKGEAPLQTAQRECMEETGIEKIPGRRFDSIRSKGKDRDFTVFFYMVDERFDVTLSGEHSDWEWVPFDSLGDTKLHPKLKEDWPKYLACIRKRSKTFKEWCVLSSLIERLTPGDAGSP